MNNKNKYPKSLTGQQCIGPCVKPEEVMLHPITLDYYTIKDDVGVDFCLINPTNDPNIIKQHAEIFNENNINNATCLGYIAPCKKSKNENKKDLFDGQDITFLFPEIDINCGKFLRIFYNIYSIENTLQYIKENQNIPKNTKIRLINCSWKEFGSNKDNITDLFVKFYWNYIRKYWMKNFYNYLGKSLFYDNKQNKVVKIKECSDDEINKKVKEKIEYLMEYVYDFESVRKVMLEFINKYKNNWNWIESHHKKIKKYFLVFGLNKLK